MRDVDKIIVHHSASPLSTTVDDIRKWHVGRGWRDIGYHFVVHGDGSIHHGRPIEQVGAHCRGHNATSIGVCVVGDNTKAGMGWTSKQRLSLRMLLWAFANAFPAATVHGHREFRPTDCPGVDRAEYWP